MRDAVIVSSVRTAVGKAPRGSFRTTRPDDLAAIVIKEALARAKGLDIGDVEDVILGCAMPEAESGSNMARIAGLRAGLPDSVPLSPRRKTLFDRPQSGLSWAQTAS